MSPSLNAELTVVDARTILSREFATEAWEETQRRPPQGDRGSGPLFAGRASAGSRRREDYRHQTSSRSFSKSASTSRPMGSPATSAHANRALGPTWSSAASALRAHAAQECGRSAGRGRWEGKPRGVDRLGRSLALPQTRSLAFAPRRRASKPGVPAVGYGRERILNADVERRTPVV